MGKCTTHQLELFYGGKPMTLARYPNISPSGDFQWMHISSVQDKQKSFEVTDERVLKWADEAEEGHAFVHGYWSFDWGKFFVYAPCMLEFENHMHSLTFGLILQQTRFSKSRRSSEMRALVRRRCL